jgi:hypothetical protein
MTGAVVAIGEAVAVLLLVANYSNKVTHLSLQLCCFLLCMVDADPLCDRGVG